MEKYNVLILGSGGREHALAWKIKQSPLLDELHIAPGNAGTAKLGKQVNLSVNDFEGIKDYCFQSQINIIVVGPEDPLVNGIVDFFKEQAPDIFVFGPNKEAAQLEGSKDFSKRFMSKYEIPTAAYGTFTKNETAAAKEFLHQMNGPYVLKADGLAAGKGVLIIEDLDEAKESVEEMLNGKFGSASETLVIEEFLSGVEVSFFAMSDGSNYVVLPEAKDYKRIGEGDTGLNTGGMGAVSPVPFVDEEFKRKVIQKIIHPTFEGLKNEGIPYEGFLFFGLINVAGEPMVIEYNCRMGDPETEVVIPRIENDLLEIIVYAKLNNLGGYDIQFKTSSCTTVIAVSGGYPESYAKGLNFHIQNEQENENQVFFYAGVSLDNSNQEVTSGGRVVACSAWDAELKRALEKSYKMIESVTYEGKYYRKDIGKDII